MIKDTYLEAFVEAAKETYGKNLCAILVYGSFVQGYFDKEQSDYDTLLYTFEPTEESVKLELNAKFPKISFHYFDTLEELKQRTSSGSWSVFAVLQTKAQLLYSTKEFDEFLIELSKKDIRPLLKQEKAIQYYKNKFEGEDKKLQETTNDYEFIKWSLPTVRRRLQIITYLTQNKVVWDLDYNLDLNPKLLTKKEITFLKNLELKLPIRTSIVSDEERAFIFDILRKLSTLTIIEMEK